MNVYHYDRYTGALLGVTQAHLDPLETKKTGSPIYLCPAHATFEAPPTPKAGKAIIRAENKWKEVDVVVPDPPKEEKKDPLPPDPYEVKIAEEIRAMAIERLQSRGEIKTIEEVVK